MFSASRVLPFSMLTNLRVNRSKPGFIIKTAIKGFTISMWSPKRRLAFYSDAVGPFSYEKLANIQSNSVSGGMEAASAILYSENSVVGDRNVRWRNVVIHEIAHQWFGNSVTEKDWDEIWLSEGFATYFTLLFIEHQYGRDEFVEGLRSSKKSVDAFYLKNPNYRLVHDNLKDMNDVTTSQIYQKGSWTLHMLRGVVGTENFWKGIKIYYHKYRDSHATVADFRRVMEEVSGKDLIHLFQPMALQARNPKIQRKLELRREHKASNDKARSSTNRRQPFQNADSNSRLLSRSNQTADANRSGGCQSKRLLDQSHRRT